jgi:putative aldouronate transport system permease protein
MVKKIDMRVRDTRDEFIFSCINVPFMVLVMLIMLYPLIHIIFASISDPVELIQHRGLLLKPYGFHVSAYKAVFQNRLLGSGYMNTLINVSCAIAVNISLTTLGAFALSRRELMLRRPLMLLITFTMVFSGGLIPLYLLVRRIGFINTRWALIFPTAISAYNLIIMRTYFEGIPESIFESARIDGADEFVVLFRIGIPMAMPVIAVMLLFYGVDQWNAWFPAYIYLRTRVLWPLQMVLREIVLENTMSDMLTGVELNDKASLGESIKYATVVVATVPILFVYPFLQKYFVKGVMIGAIKG